MTKILSIGLGGVGTIAAYGLQEFNDDVQITAVIRSDYDRVTTDGYTISSCDYGGLGKDGAHEPEKDIKGFKPRHVVKSVEAAEAFGPYDYIVVSTKVIPGPKGTNVWDQVIDLPRLIHAGADAGAADDATGAETGKKTSLVLIQNGIDIEKYWAPLASKVVFLSGVSYISSVNRAGTVSQYTPDRVSFGFFHVDGLTAADEAALDTFLALYGNKHNLCTRDDNVRLTRWKKLLYNASFNTVCCLTNLDVGHVFYSGVVPDVITPLMHEVRLVANEDLKKNFHSTDFVEETDIAYILEQTEIYNVKNHYQPSMLVDLRQNRMIELEIILSNIVACYRDTTDRDPALQIPYLNLLNYLLTMVQYRIKTSKE